MKTKNLFRTLIISLLLSVFLLTGCIEQEAKLVSWEFSEDNPTEIKIGEFNYDDFTILEQYSDGSIIEVKLNDTMVSVYDFFKTYKIGEQSLTVNYKKISHDLVLQVKSMEFGNVYVVNQTVTYDGNYHSLEVQGEIPEGTTVTFPRGNSYKNAGTYPITAVLASDKYITKSITGTLVIEKANFDTSNLTFESKEFTYDGNSKELVVAGNLPKDATIKYYIGSEELNRKTDAGTYTVVAKINPGQNYNPVQDLTATLKINKGVYDISRYKIQSKTYYYNGEEIGLKINDEDTLPDGVSVEYYYSITGKDEYTTDLPVNAGSYTCQAIFKGDPNNYELIGSLYGTLTIRKARIELTTIHFDSLKVTFDKNYHSIYYTGVLPTGVSFINYVGNSKRDVGTYKVEARFAYNDTVNYEAIEPLTATLEIVKADIKDLKFENKEVEYDGYGHQLSVDIDQAPNGLIVSYDNNNFIEPNSEDEDGYRVTASFSFEAGSEAEKNYNLPKDMSAVLTITKKDISSFFENVTLEFDNKYHMLYVDEDKLEDWITPIYKIFNSSGNYESVPVHTVNGEQAYGYKDPGSYVIFVEYEIDPSMQAEYEAHYKQIVRDSAILNISKATINLTEYIEDRKIIYDTDNHLLKVIGTEIIDIYTEPEENSTQTKLTLLDFADLYLSGANLTDALEYQYFKNGELITEAKDAGIYQGKVNATLNENALKYITLSTENTFYFAIKDPNNIETYTPVYSGTLVTYDGKPHSLTLNNRLENTSVDLGDSKIDAGEYDITVTYYMDEILMFYYQLPSNYTIQNGNYVANIRLTIEKQEVYIEFDDGPFEYNGQAQKVKAINLPSYITIKEKDYVYRESEIIKPGTYHVTVTPRLSTDDAYSNFKVSPKEITFEIVKGTAPYSIDGLSYLYDGDIHKVLIHSLPDEFVPKVEYYVDGEWKIDSGVKEVGEYDVRITFNRNSNISEYYYNDISPMLLKISIKSIKIDTSNLFAYLNTIDGKKTQIDQFTNINDLLKTIMDLNAFSVSWNILYYEGVDSNTGNPIPTTNLDKIANGILPDDYTFTYPTDKTNLNEYVQLSVVLTRNPGYVYEENVQVGNEKYFNNDNIRFNIRLLVQEAIEIELDELEANFSTNFSCAQGTNVRDIFKLYVDFSTADIDYTVHYYNGINIYDDEFNNDYHGVGTKVSNYYLNTNTWDNRYALVSYKITPHEGYYFSDSQGNYQVYEKDVKVTVNPKSKLDNSFLKEALTTTNIALDQYTSLTKYINSLIDTMNTDTTYTLLHENPNTHVIEVVGNQESENIILTESDSYTFCIKSEAKSGFKFTDNSTVFSNGIYVDNLIDNGITITINPKQGILIDNIENAFNNLSYVSYSRNNTVIKTNNDGEKIYQYNDYFIDYYLKYVNDSLDLTGLSVSWKIEFLNSTLDKKTGTLKSVLENQNVSFAYLKNSTTDTKKFKVIYTITPDNNHVLIDSNNNNIGVQILEYTYNIENVSIIDTSEVKAIINKYVVNNTYNIDQYQFINTYFGDLFNNIMGYDDSIVLKITYENNNVIKNFNWVKNTESKYCFDGQNSYKFKINIKHSNPLKMFDNRDDLAQSQKDSCIKSKTEYEGEFIVYINNIELLNPTTAAANIKTTYNVDIETNLSQLLANTDFTIDSHMPIKSYEISLHEKINNIDILVQDSKKTGTLNNAASILFNENIAASQNEKTYYLYLTYKASDGYGYLDGSTLLKEYTTSKIEIKVDPIKFVIATELPNISTPITYKIFEGYSKIENAVTSLFDSQKYSLKISYNNVKEVIDGVEKNVSEDYFDKKVDGSKYSIKFTLNDITANQKYVFVDSNNNKYYSSYTIEVPVTFTAIRIVIRTYYSGNFSYYMWYKTSSWYKFIGGDAGTEGASHCSPIYDYVMYGFYETSVQVDSIWIKNTTNGSESTMTTSTSDFKTRIFAPGTYQIKYNLSTKPGYYFGIEEGNYENDPSQDTAISRTFKYTNTTGITVYNIDDCIIMDTSNFMNAFTTYANGGSFEDLENTITFSALSWLTNDDIESFHIELDEYSPLGFAYNRIGEYHYAKGYNIYSSDAAKLNELLDALDKTEKPSSITYRFRISINIEADHTKCPAIITKENYDKNCTLEIKRIISNEKSFYVDGRKTG